VSMGRWRRRCAAGATSSDAHNDPGYSGGTQGSGGQRRRRMVLRAMAEIESAPAIPGRPAPIHYHPANMRRRSNSWHAPPSRCRQSSPTYPPPQAGRVGWGGHRCSSTTYSQGDIRDDLVFEYRSSGAGPEQRTEPLPETGALGRIKNRRRWSPAQDAAFASTKPVHVEPRPLPSLIGVIQQTALYVVHEVRSRRKARRCQAFSPDRRISLAP